MEKSQAWGGGVFATQLPKNNRGAKCTGTNFCTFVVTSRCLSSVPGHLVLRMFRTLLADGVEISQSIIYRISIILYYTYTVQDTMKMLHLSIDFQTSVKLYSLYFWVNFTMGQGYS